MLKFERMKLLLFSLLFFLCSLSYSQEWFNNGTTWHYRYNVFASEGYERWTSMGDTTLLGLNCKIIKKERIFYSFISNDTIVDPIDFEYLLYRNDTISFWNGNGFIMLYDFNANVGDIWEVKDTKYQICGCDTIGYVQVDSIKMEVFNTDSLKVIYTSPYDSSHFQYYGKIIEKIGGTFDWFPHISSFCGSVDCDEGIGEIICYEDSDISYNFWNELYGITYDCETLPTSIIDEPNTNSYNIYPNPFNDDIKVSSIKQIVNIRLLNLTGQVIMDIKNKNKLNTKKLRDGIYIIEITFDSGEKIKRKVIKQSH